MRCRDHDDEAAAPRIRLLVIGAVDTDRRQLRLENNNNNPRRLFLEPAPPPGVNKKRRMGVIMILCVWVLLLVDDVGVCLWWWLTTERRLIRRFVVVFGEHTRMMTNDAIYRIDGMGGQTVGMVVVSRS